MVYQQLQCPSGVPLRYTVCHTACRSFASVRAATMSFIQLHSFASSFVTLHPFAAKYFASWLGTLWLSHMAKKVFTIPFAKPRHGSLGFISLIRRCFISAGFSPSAVNNLARRPPTSAAFTLRLLIAHSYLISQSIAKVHLHSSAAYVPFGKFTPAASYGASIVAATWLSFFSFIRKVAATLLLAPSWGSPALPFVPLSSAVWRLATSATVPTSVQHGYASFFAAGAFTGRLTHNLPCF
jgi:hypothetical protein